MTKRASLLFLPCLCCLLAACGIMSSTPSTAVKGIQVVAELGANYNTATAIDFVFVYDKTTLDMLSTTGPKTGPEWFEQKNALTSGLANSIDVVPLQIPPAMIVNVNLPARYGKAIGVYSYANYIGADGQQKINLTPYKNATLWLTPTAVVCSNCE